MELHDIIAGKFPVKGITADSRRVQPGFLFVAISGTTKNGLDFIPTALEKGAIGIIIADNATLPAPLPNHIHLFKHPNPRLCLVQILAQVYAPMPAIRAAVTGTNGKTSIAHFTRYFWQKLGYKAASIGTLGVVTDALAASELPKISLTSPDPETMHQVMHLLKQHGVDHIAIEASSHGLDQYRLDALAPFKAVGFTNLSRDHLDYHGTMEHYFSAKMRLFDALIGPGSTAVINADIPEYPVIEAIASRQIDSHQGGKIIPYGRDADANHPHAIQILSVKPVGMQQHVSLRIKGKVIECELPLIGEFQLYNIICAAGIVMAEDIPIETLIELMAQAPAVPGRLEVVTSINHPTKKAVIDYAHTPDALEKALTVLRPYAKGKLILVVGCGGDRDRGKRELMGEIALRYADQTIITDDNPRTEDPSTIRASIQKSCPHALNIADRKQAIHLALSQAGEDDIVLIAGKGHEKFQIIGNEYHPFDDCDVVRHY